MDLVLLKQFLFWCLLINYAILLLWFGIWLFGRDAIYRLHSRWFNIPRERFDTLFYCLMGAYKLGVLLFNLTPLLALLILT